MIDINPLIFDHAEKEAVLKIDVILRTLNSEALISVDKEKTTRNRVEVCVKLYEPVNQAKLEREANGAGFYSVEFSPNGSSFTAVYKYDWCKIREVTAIPAIRNQLIGSIRGALDGYGYVDEVKEENFNSWTIKIDVTNDPETNKSIVYDKVFDALSPILIIQSSGELGISGYWFIGTLR